MEKEKNYTPIIITFGIIIFIVLIGVYYIGKSSNNSPLENSQTPTTASTQPSATQPPQVKNQVDTNPVTTAPQTNNTQANNTNINSATTLANKAMCQKYMQQQEDEATQRVLSEHISIYRIFYSPIRNSCVVLKYSLNANNVDGESLTIKDILDNTIIWQQYYPSAMKYWDAQSVLDNRVQLLGLEK